ncbi:MAG: 30S ribosomal protein S4, partial [Promethearchaeota archaeon]
MGDPRRLKKKFRKPKHPYNKERILEELEFLGKFGLRNKREFWKMRTMLGNWRKIARETRTLSKEQAAEAQKELIKKLNRLGVLGPEAEFDDILLLTVEDLLKRRLQTLVFEKGMAQTIYEARQKIVHKHIAISDKIINSPSYIVKKEEEELIRFAPSSPFA